MFKFSASKSVLANAIRSVLSPSLTGANGEVGIITPSLNYLKRIGGETVQRIDGNKVVTTNPSN